MIAERALRPVAIGRRNYLFAGSDAGARRAAILYSLIGTARINGLDPEAHLPGGEHRQQANSSVAYDSNVMSGFTFAASAANQPVPRTSEVARRFGIISFVGTPGVDTRVPSASGTRSSGA
jgi:Transposase IS66 family